VMLASIRVRLLVRCSAIVAAWRLVTVAVGFNPRGAIVDPRTSRVATNSCARNSLAVPQGMWRRLLAVASAPSRLIPSPSSRLAKLIKSHRSCLKEV
jgi:hypothetical protein